MSGAGESGGGGSELSWSGADGYVWVDSVCAEPVDCDCE